MSKLSRFGWGSMAILFLLTSLTFGILAIVQNHNSNSSQDIGLPCSQGGSVPNQQPGKDGKVKGAKLADFSPPQKISSIACIDYKIGSGATATTSSTVTVNYVGALASTGQIFDDSFDGGQALTIGLGQVIPGWQLGVQGMKIGGIRRLFIPAGLGYGAQAAGAIPANSDLVFDIQLINLK